MKLTRKFIPAFAMLLLSAVLLSTASYAWFTSNSNVAATGVVVQATTATNLLISKTSSTEGYEVSVAIGTGSAVTLKPVSTNAAITTAGEELDEDDVFADDKFFTLSDTATGINYTSGALGADTVLQAAVANTDFISKTFWIKLEGDTSASYSNLYLDSLNVVRGSSQVDVSKSLRVAVVATTADSTIYSYLFAPNDGSYIDGKSVASLDTDNKAVLAEQAISEETVGTAVTFGAINADEVVTVTVFVWHEGNDVNCKSTNATAVEQMDISLNFAVA
jgi:hypothetical protein